MSCFLKYASYYERKQYIHCSMFPYFIIHLRIPLTIKLQITSKKTSSFKNWHIKYQRITRFTQFVYNVFNKSYIQTILHLNIFVQTKTHMFIASVHFVFFRWQSPWIVHLLCRLYHTLSVWLSFIIWLFSS